MKKTRSQSKAGKRKKARPLAEQIYLLACAVESLQEAVFITDCRRRVIYANPAAGKIFGYNLAEILGKKAAEFFENVPGNPSGLADRIKKEAERGLWTGEIFNRRKNGEVFPAWLMLNTIYGPRGGVLGYIGISRPLSEEEQTREEGATLRTEEGKAKAPPSILASAKKDEQIRFLAHAMESLQEAVIITDCNHTIIYANPAIEKIHGYRPAELLGREASCLFEGIPGNLPDLAAKVKKRVRDNVWIDEVFSRRKDGSIIPVRLIVNTVFGKQGNILGSIGIFRDISPDRRLEKEFEKERDRLKNLIQAIPDVVYLKDMVGHYLMVNQAFLKITGWKEDRIIGKKDSELFPSDQARQYRQSDLMAFKSSRSIDSQEQFIAPNGEVRYLHTVKTLIRNAEGRKIGLLGVSRDFTEARKAENALAESEEKYRILSENSLTGIFILSAEGKLIYFNKTLMKLSGYGEKDLRNKPFLDFIHREDRGMVKETFLRRLEGLSTPDHYVCRALRRDGSIAWIEIRAALITWQGKPAVLGNFFDITEQKRHEEELLRHALVYRSMQEAVIISTDDGRIVDANPAVEKQFGWSRKELIGKPAEMLNPPDQARKIGKDIFLGLRKRGVWRGEIPVITKSGEYRTFSTVVTALRDKSGKQTGSIGISRDVTEWKEQAVALEESEERYRSTINSMEDPIHVIDRNYRLLLFNEAFKEWHKELGLKTDVIGKNLFEVFPLLPAKVKSEYQRVFKDGRILVSKENINLGGREIFIETRKIPVRDGERVSRIITVIRDVTERKQAETRLREASKLEGVGTLCLGFSHEFNNILMGISGYAQLALADLDDRRMILKALEVVSRQTERGKELIQRLSSFGRRAKPSLEPVALCRVLDEVIAVQELELKNADIRVRKQYESKSPALADYSQLVQVFFNLLRNARQALAGKKKGMITLQTRDKGRMLEIVVGDNGVGIPFEELPKIFLPFFTTKRKSKNAQLPSLGLGLWVCRQIVEEMGGTIEVRSRSGRGTKFFIRLPRAEADKKKLQKKTARPRRPEAVPKDGKKLLIVDDEEDLLAVYGEYFRKRGFRVTLASSGMEAVRLSEKERFEFILLDYVMPRFSGKRLAKKIKELNPESRVLIITGQTVPPEEKKGLKPYVYRWLKKPLDLREILAVVRK